VRVENYFIYWATSLIVMHVAIKCKIYFVFFPKLLQALPCHWFSKGAFLSIVVSRGMAKHMVCNKDQPWLPLPFNQSKALL
jgi:hypothetical protein